MNTNEDAATGTAQSKWYTEGYRAGTRFAREEAEYEELAEIARSQGIPARWDIFRAEILNAHLGNPEFDFQSYESGFSQACTELFEKI
ncbi:MAG: hypothetical protein KGY61_14065 [Desulfobacterales bacterium]|nr:hypothetical protein [Desulfobacterales bacterium]